MGHLDATWPDAFRIANLEPHVVAFLAGSMSERVLAPGETLVREGEDGDSMFLVLDGRLEVTLESPQRLALGELGPGSIAGEVAVLVGGKRSATIRAIERSVVGTLTRERFAAAKNEGAEIGEAFSRALHARMRRTRIAVHLRDLVGELDSETLEALAKRVSWVQLASGEELFREGDPADAAYIVVLGRLGVVVRSPDDTEAVIDEVGPGEWIGEMGLLTASSRSATVYAMRDSELLCVSHAVFEELICRRPEALLQTSRALVSRLQRQMSATAPAKRRRTRTIAIVPISQAADVRWFARELVEALSKFGTLMHLDAARVDAELGKEGIARATPGHAAHLRLSSWLMEQEQTFETIVYEADPTWSEWTDRTLRHADEILFVGDGTGDPRLGEAELRVRERGKPTRRPQQSLVLLQPGRRHAYAGAAAWLRDREVAGHHHVRIGNTADVARVARILTGNAICVVFGGGGSRGLAHIGVVRALERHGVPVDAVGGTSIGAVIATAKAWDLTAEEMLRVVPPLMSTAFFEPTLPIVSLMAGKNIMRNVYSFAGTTEIEDLVLPMFAVSTNLTRGGEMIHRRGSVALAMRTSGSVPGIFPPVPYNGDLLVDGGLSNNVPVDVMAAAYGGRIIAIDVIPEVDLAVAQASPLSLSGWTAAWQRIRPFGAPPAAPSIRSILMRSATTSSQGLRNAREMERRCALYLRPPVSRWNVLDFKAAASIADEAERATDDQIGSWWARDRASVVPRT